MNNFKIDEILIGLILLSLTVSFAVNSFFLVLVSLFFIYKTLNNGSFINLKTYYISFVFFAAQFYSYLISNNKEVAALKLLLFMSFILFPFIFSYLSSKKIVIDEIKIFKFLFFGTIIILFYGSLRFLYDVIFLNERYDYGRAVALLLKYIPHHIYMSMFILISIYSIILGRIENSVNKKSIFIVPLMCLFLIVLGSRMAIFLSIIILPVFLYIKLSKKDNKRKNIILGGSLFVFIIIIGFSNNYVRDKVIYTYYDFLNIATQEKPFFGISYRRQVWSNVINLIHKSPLYGYGIGDIQEILNKSYKKEKLFGLNAHNLYLQFMLHYGVILSGILFLLVFKLFRLCKSNKSSILIFSWVVMLFFSLTESILNRQWGVVLFAFILNFSIYKNDVKKRNNDKS